MVSRKTILITVDVEGVPLSTGTVDYSSIAKGVRVLLELFREFDVHATFFVTRDALEKNVGVLRRVLKEGHEVGCHGYRQNTSSRQYVSLEAETNSIINLLKVTPVGFRAHHFQINAAILQALVKLGYKYDSSIIAPSSLLSRQHFRNTPKAPYHPDLSDIYIEGDSPILEIPVSALPMVSLPLALSYMKLFALRLYKALLLRSDQSLLTLYLHPYDLFSLPSGVVNVPFFFRMFQNVGAGLPVLREVLETFEEHFSPIYICAKDVIAQYAYNRSSSLLECGTGK